MILPEISIKRPILASMMNIALVLVGIVSMLNLPVREVPDIDPPIVDVSTTYIGASSNVVETEVTEKLEEVINGIEGIKTLSSESREELSKITIEFELWRDIDLAAQDVRDRVDRVRGELPSDIEEPIIAKQESDASPIMWVALFSDTHSTLKLTEIAEDVFKDPLQTVKGVSSIILGGSKRYAIRIRLDSNLMAARQITVLDVERALKEQNVEIPSGKLENLERELSIRTMGELKTPEDFNRLVLRREGANLVRLRDVGYAESGVENEDSIARYNSKPAMGLGVVKQSKANTVSVAKGIIAELERLKPIIPEGVETFIAYDESIFVEEAIEEVWWSLLMSFGLVVLSIYVFLNNFRSTLVPSLTIPVSIVATFAIISWFGFSINILTMLGLVLAIGLVVDDSIVVLENIYRHVEEGKTPMQAAFISMKEISFAVIATTVALVAVFIPLSFQSSITGRLFAEFSLTLCAAVVVSTFVALTLTPSAAARILRARTNDLSDTASRSGSKNGFIERLTERYRRLLVVCLDNRKMVLSATAVMVGVAAFFYMRLEKEFLPDEDKGRLFNLAIAPEGATPEYTDRMVRQMEEIISSYPEVHGYFSAVALSRGGPGRSSEGLMFVRFRPERDRSVQDLLDGPNGIRSRFFSEVEGALALAILPQSIGRGYSQSFQLALQHDNLDKLDEYVQKVSQALRETGMLFGVRSAFEFNKPQLEVKIERERAAALGVPIDAIARTLQILFGGRDLSDIKIGGKQYDVIVQLNRESRLRPADLDRVHVRSDSGGLIQLSNLVKYSEVAGPNAIFHYNRIRSATIEGTPVGSVALGTAIENTEAILEEMLPADFRYVWKGEASDLQETGSETWFVILLAVLTIYIVLAAQFESLVHPITVMVALPLAAIGASGSLWLLNQVDSLGTMLYGWANYSPDPPAIAGILSGLVPRIPSMTINVFSQIGMVLLLGLVTKNSILLVEFANQQRAKGVSAREAMLEAAAIRFRPILMTALGTITGIFPIAIGFGAGAESRRPMGVAVVGGMTTATVLTFFVIPVVYVIFDEIKERVFSKPNPRLPGAMLLLAFLASCLFKRDILAEEASLSGPSKLSLSKAVDLALEHNLDIITAKNRIEQQRNVKLEVRSYMLPRVALDGSYEQVDDSLVETFREDAFGSNKNFDSKLELRQPLYAGGKSMAAYRRESLRELAAELELREVELEVVMDVEARFLDVLLAKSKLSVQKQSVELLEEALRSEKEKLKVGDVSQFNVLRAEVEVANSLTRLIRAKNEVNLSYEELLQIIGFLQEDLSLKKKPFALDGELRQKAFAISLEDALHKALTNRPHIKRLKLLIDASKQGVKVEKADYWPVVVAVGSYGVEKSRFSNDLSDTLNGWRARIEANWKIFDSWQTSSRIAERQSEVLNAEAALRQARLDVEVEAKQAYSSLREARTLLKASRKVVETAEESVRLAINRINAGAGIQLDLLNAQVALTEARLNEVQALYDYNLAVARMKRATGKGVTDRDRGSL